MVIGIISFCYPTIPGVNRNWIALDINKVIFVVVRCVMWVVMNESAVLMKDRFVTVLVISVMVVVFVVFEEERFPVFLKVVFENV